MNATIRVIKGTLALIGLVAVYLLLRWITAGSISGLRTYDLDSLTVLVVGTVAWIAYGWLVLAVVLTALEQIPGAVGALAGAVASRITTKTARALLRSGLGVAAVTPLTVGAAQATPGTTAHVQQWTQPSSATQSANYRATEPRSTVQLGGASWSTQPGSAAGFGDRSTEPRSTVELGGANTSYRFTEPASTVELGGSDTAADQSTDDFRATEPRSTVELGGSANSPEQVARTNADTTAPRHTNQYRATEPRSTVELGDTDSTPQAHTDYRTTEPPSQVRLTNLTPNRPSTPGHSTPDSSTHDSSRPGGSKRGRSATGNPTPGRTAAGHPTPGRPSAPGAGAAGRVDGGRTTSDRPTAPSESVAPDATPAHGQEGANEQPDGGRTGGNEKPARGQKRANELPARGQNGANELPAGGRNGAKELPGGQQSGNDLPRGGRPRVGVPDRPTAGAPTRYTNLRPEVPVRVVVRKGDSLWSIAARELGPRASADAIATRWPDWYAANRHVIGNDPDLILPGQVLRIPPAPTGDHLPPHPQEQ